MYKNVTHSLRVEELPPWSFTISRWTRHHAKTKTGDGKIWTLPQLGVKASTGKGSVYFRHQRQTPLLKARMHTRARRHAHTHTQDRTHNYSHSPNLHDAENWFSFFASLLAIFGIEKMIIHQGENVILYFDVWINVLMSIFMQNLHTCCNKFWKTNSWWRRLHTIFHQPQDCL